MKEPNFDVGEARCGFTWGPHIAVQRTAVLADGRRVITITTVDDDRTLAVLDVIVSKYGRRISTYRPRLRRSSSGGKR